MMVAIGNIFQCPKTVHVKIVCLVLEVLAIHEWLTLMSWPLFDISLARSLPFFCVEERIHHWNYSDVEMAEYVVYIDDISGLNE